MKRTMTKPRRRPDADFLPGDRVATRRHPDRPGYVYHVGHPPYGIKVLLDTGHCHSFNADFLILVTPREELEA